MHATRTIRGQSNAWTCIAKRPPIGKNEATSLRFRAMFPGGRETASGVRGLLPEPLTVLGFELCRCGVLAERLQHSLRPRPQPVDLRLLELLSIHHTSQLANQLNEWPQGGLAH